MEIIVQSDREQVANLTAHLVIDLVKNKPNATLGLATGRTMEPVYKAIAEIHSHENLSFAQVKTFNLDEFIGVPPDSPSSYRTFMRHHLFSKVDLQQSHTHLPDGTAVDLNLECENYERAITESGGIDLQLLGLGTNGHIGFNEPLSSLRSRTRTKSLTPETIEANRHLFTSTHQPPTRAITMGVETILDSRRCVMVVFGERKAEIVAKVVEGSVTAQLSATALHFHKNCQIILDPGAASKLKNLDYYKWVFENEPEWEKYRT